MKHNGHFHVMNLIVFVFINLVLCSCAINVKPQSEVATKIDFYKMINEDIANTKLSIYYASPSVVTRKPRSVSDLLENYDYRVIIDGDTLKKHISLFRKMNNASLQDIAENLELDCRIYYKLEHVEKGILFDVAMWDSDGRVVVNGEKTTDDSCFYDVITILTNEQFRDVRL